MFYKPKQKTDWLLAIIFSIIGSLILTVALSYQVYDIDGVRLGVSVRPALEGTTQVSIPPFGDITASTHSTPIRLNVTLERIYPDELQEVAVETHSEKQLVDRLETGASQIMRDFIIRLIVISALGGAVGALIPPRRRFRKALAGAFIGFALVGGILAGTYFTYDTQAFKQPQYSGVLSAAPWMTEEIARRVGDFGEFRAEMQKLADNMNEFHSRTDAWQPLQPDNVRVLHVSDIHNNPVAFDLIAKMVRDFDIDFVVDTGDLVDYGTSLEATIAERIAELPVPYVFVPGNHESPEVVEYVRAIPNVIVLEGEVVEVEGIAVVGAPDPSAASLEMSPVGNDVLGRAADELYEQAILKSGTQPFIAAVHQPEHADRLIDHVPLVLVGHTHKQEIIEHDSTVVVNAGTTGAAGIRTFEAEQAMPYSLSLIHIQREPLSVVAIDSISLSGVEREFTLERRLVDFTDVGGENAVGIESQQ